VLYFDSFLKAKGLKLITDIKDNIILKIDRNDAIRLIDNIISNAIKYNNQNGILKISLDKRSFIVEDSGIGINKNDLSKLTERFKRANNSEGGFGLGLSIVSEIAKNYNYKLDIKSKLNKGTIVCIRW
jgi:two-component system OmpR family sensor kinase